MQNKSSLLFSCPRRSLSYQKIAIKSDKITPFGGIFWVMQQFDRSLSQVIDSTLGVRCKFYGYQYSEILRSLMCIYFCGGSCVEDLSSHLINHLSLHPKLRTCSADTILRVISELAQSNISYTSDACKNMLSIRQKGSMS